MELLHGKAKEIFKKYISFNHGLDLNDWECKKSIYFNALVIEWFDLFGLKIGIEPLIDSSFRSFVLGYDNLHHWIDNRFDSRQEATTEAIKKAVEIFNEKHI